MTGKKILIGIPPRAHVSLAMDEVEGLTKMGYQCSTVSYGRNNQSVSALNKLMATVIKAFKMVKMLYRHSPEFLYLNSRFEPAGSTRDFISILIIRLFYFKKIKIIIKSHGSDCSLLLKKAFWYKKLLVPYLKKNVQAWFFLSTDEKKLIASIDEEIGKKISVIPNIIDPARCVTADVFKEKYHLPKNKFKFLFVGRMVRVKGVFDILNSLPLLTCKNDCAFIFVGDGDDFIELKQMAATLKVDHLVSFAGYLPDKECDHFYANCDALIFPTYDTEGFPMALFKSVAVGIPVITTRIRAAKDYLHEPANVIWVKEKSPQSIADAITTLMVDMALQKSIQQNNKILGEQFAASKVCSLMSQVFLSIP
jgi:glycosyltransferase involved in cell wall biosynthesis